MVKFAKCDKGTDELFGQKQLALLGTAQPIKLPFVLDPYLIPAATQIPKRNDLWQHLGRTRRNNSQWITHLFRPVTLGSIVCVGHDRSSSLAKIFHNKICENDYWSIVMRLSLSNNRW